MTTSATPGETNFWDGTHREKIDRWEESLGVPPFRIPGIRDEAVHYLELSREDRTKLTPDEAAEASLVLAQWASYVQRACQREEAEAELLQEQITELIRTRVSQHHAYDAKERRSLAIAENEQAVRLERLRIAASVKVKRLAYFAMRIDRISQAYGLLSNSRKRQREYGD